MTRALRVIVAALMWCGVVLFPLVPVVHADVFQPAYLELRELGGGRYAVVWRVPAQDEQTRLALHVVMPEGTVPLGEPRTIFTGSALVERWQVQRPGGLTGQTIRIGGRAAGVTDVIARLERQDGTSQVERLRVEAPAFVITPPAGVAEIGWSYLVLGVEHILGGVDHLLFVFALLVIVRGTRRIVGTITAFTVAHSVTLVAAALGVIALPGPPVEAVIALSIVFVAAEAVHALQGRSGLTARAPWVVAFSFGLLHGLGFAGALSEIGLPQTAIPLALLIFNVGVEIGQLSFVGVVTLGAALARRLSLPQPRWAAHAVPYAIGAVAMFWVIERVTAF